MADVQPSFALPELGRSLRALGSVRDACAERAHAAVFGPLLEARARAAEADTQTGVLDALRGRALGARVERLAVDAARVGANDDAVARARMAQAREMLEPLFASIEALDTAAASIQPSSRIDGYKEFVDRLTAVFAAADVACGRLAALLAAEPTAGRSRWGRGRPK